MIFLAVLGDFGVFFLPCNFCVLGGLILGLQSCWVILGVFVGRDGCFLFAFWGD